MTQVPSGDSLEIGSILIFQSQGENTKDGGAKDVFWVISPKYTPRCCITCDSESECLSRNRVSTDMSKIQCKQLPAVSLPRRHFSEGPCKNTTSSHCLPPTSLAAESERFVDLVESVLFISPFHGKEWDMFLPPRAK